MTAAPRSWDCTGVARAQGKTLRVGTTLDATGPEKANGLAMHQGSTAFFNALNRNGGLNGTKVELLFADDKFNVDAAKNNALAFRADPSVVALLHPLGMRQTVATMVAFQDLPILGPFTGTAGCARSRHRTRSGCAPATTRRWRS